jgi:putative hydrolase of the HAD superfamily
VTAGRFSACLIDVFGTVLSTDFPRYTAALAERADVDADAFATSVVLWSKAVMDGSTSIEDALAETVAACGGSASPSLVAELVALDLALVRDLSVLHDDTVPFLESLRERGVRTAFVSNCSSNTRPLLDHLGISGLVDEMVLSCEAGAAKPDPEIYRVALERLGVRAADAVFVDDQVDYCAGAAALGIHAVRIDRLDGEGDIATLAELAPYF